MSVVLNYIKYLRICIIVFDNLKLNFWRYQIRVIKQMKFEVK
jgi:hypothetical protein